MEQLINAIYTKISRDYCNKNRIFATFTFRIPKKLRKELDIEYLKNGIKKWINWRNIEIIRMKKILKIKIF